MAAPSKRPTSETIFDALGNPVRRSLLTRLSQGPCSVGELAEGLPISRPAVSRHLKVLEGARLVRHASRGTQNIFHIDSQGFKAASGWLNRFWDDALARFTLVAENLPDPHKGED